MPNEPRSAWTTRPGDVQMAHATDRSKLTRLVRLTAILLFSALLFGWLAGGASAMNVKTANPGAAINLTPIVVDPLPPVSPTGSVEPSPTDVLTVDPAPTEIAESNSTNTVVVDPGPTQAPVDVVDTVDVQTSAGENAPESPSTGGYNFVYLDLMLCPKGYVAPDNAEQALADCGARASGAKMDLIDGAGHHPQTANLSVSWESIVNGPVTIKQIVSPFQKAPFLFCRSINGAFVSEPIEDGAFQTSIVANQERYCAWFITPKVRPTDGIVGNTSGTLSGNVDSIPNPGSLIVNGSSTCPAGFDAASATIYQLAANCHDAGPIADFHVGSADVLQTTLASFDSVPAGDQTVSLTLPSGYGAPRVFCKSQQGGAETEVVVTNNSWQVGIIANQIAYCDAINTYASAGGASSVISDANACDASVINGDFSHANLAQNCSTLTDVTVTVSQNGQQITSGTTATSVVFSNGLSAGDVHVEGRSNSIVPADVIVYCNISGVGNDTALMAADGAIDLTLTDNETVNCSWFFISAGGPGAGEPVDDGATPVNGDGSDDDGNNVTGCGPTDHGDATGNANATPASGDPSSQIVPTAQSAGAETAL